MPARSPELLVSDAAAWRSWLSSEGLSSPVIWLIVAKKNAIKSPTSLTYAEALDEAICHGWIDSGGCKRDENTYYYRFTPRKARSMWSKINVGHAERLEREGRMQEPGRAAVEQAKANGLWGAAYNAQAPADLLAAVVKVPKAKARWDVLPKKDLYALYVRLGALAAGSEAREKRIQGIVDGLQRAGTAPTSQKKTAKSATRRRRSGKVTPTHSQRVTRSSSRAH